MKDFIRSILAAGVTVGLSDREAFVKHVSGVIEKYQTDPEKAEQWANAAVDYFETMRDYMNTKQAIKGAIDSSSLPDKDQLQELTNAIKQLTKELRDQKERH